MASLRRFIGSNTFSKNLRSTNRSVESANICLQNGAENIHIQQGNKILLYFRYYHFSKVKKKLLFLVKTCDIAAINGTVCGMITYLFLHFLVVYAPFDIVSVFVFELEEQMTVASLPISSCSTGLLNVILETFWHVIVNNRPVDKMLVIVTVVS